MSVRTLTIGVRGAAALGGTSSASGRMIPNIMATVLPMEREVIGERTSAALQQRSLCASAMDSAGSGVFRISIRYRLGLIAPNGWGA